MAKERQERALQLERRKLADGFVQSMLSAYPDAPFASDFTEDEKKEAAQYVASRVAHRTSVALAYADELIKQTGGGI